MGSSRRGLRSTIWKPSSAARAKPKHRSVRRARASSRCATMSARPSKVSSNACGDIDARRKQLGDPPPRTHRRKIRGSRPNATASISAAARSTARSSRRGCSCCAQTISSSASRRSAAICSRVNCSGAPRARSIRASGCRPPAKVPETVEGVAWLLRSWWGFARDSAGYGRIAAALATLTALAIGVFIWPLGQAPCHASRLVRHALCACVHCADHAAAHRDHHAGAGRRRRPDPRGIRPDARAHHGDRARADCRDRGRELRPRRRDRSVRAGGAGTAVARHVRCDRAG